jgi:UDP-N-acetylglucosamine--dolichyl-phosphate N-acetylglucosaminephosphotransferase
METLIILTIFISFMLSFLILPYWIRHAKNNNYSAIDMHKNGTEKVAEGGGIPVVFGLVIGILMYVALKTFYFKNNEEIDYVLALSCVVLMSSIVGIIDDLLGWKKGLPKKLRLIIIAFSAIPLMALNVGVSIMDVPFFGNFDFGIFFPLIIIPLGVVGATTTFNFIAGYNGLESSQGILILSALSIATYLTGSSWISVIALYGVAALLAFYIFNFHPARIFPGNSLTYAIGAMIAGIAILGNIEKIAVIFFMPYIFETILKLRGGLKKESYGKLVNEGILEEPYDKIYGIEHLAIRILKKVKKSKKVYEKEVVLFINFIQILFIVFGLLML